MPIEAEVDGWYGLRAFGAKPNRNADHDLQRIAPGAETRLDHGSYRTIFITRGGMPKKNKCCHVLIVERYPMNNRRQCYVMAGSVDRNYVSHQLRRIARAIGLEESEEEIPSDRLTQLQSELAIYVQAQRQNHSCFQKGGKKH